MRPRGSPGELERRRLRAVELLNQEYQPVEVARIVGVDRRSVRRWKSAYLKDGLSAVMAKPAPGRPLKLDEKARTELERRLLLGGGEGRGVSHRPVDLSESGPVHPQPF